MFVVMNKEDFHIHSIHASDSVQTEVPQTDTVKIAKDTFAGEQKDTLKLDSSKKINAITDTNQKKTDTAKEIQADTVSATIKDSAKTDVKEIVQEKVEIVEEVIEMKDDAAPKTYQISIFKNPVKDKSYSGADYKISPEVKQNEWIKKPSLEAKDIIVKKDTTQTILVPVKKEQNQVGKTKPVYGDWILFLIIASLIVLAWFRIFFNKYLSLLFHSVISYANSWKLFESGSASTQRISFFLNLLFVVNLSLTIYILLTYFGIMPYSYSGLELYGIIAGIIAVIYIGKFLIYSFLGSVFNAEIITKEYLHSVFLYNKVLGIFLLVINIAIPYISSNMTKPSMIMAFVVFFIFLLFRLIRGFQISAKNNVSIFYLILYLCILEILPVLMVSKYISTLL